MPIRTRYFMEHPKQFNIATFASNEMERGDGLTPLAKIHPINCHRNTTGKNEYEKTAGCFDRHDAASHSSIC